jgi:hypothetical protein
MNTPHSTPDNQLRQSLLDLAADISTHHTTPPASIIWLRAERRRRQLAIERATRPLRIMYALGIVVAIVAATFALHQSALTRSTSITSPWAWLSLATLVMLAGCSAMFLVGRSTGRTIRASNTPLH